MTAPYANCRPQWGGEMASGQYKYTCGEVEWVQRNCIAALWLIPYNLYFQHHERGLPLRTR